jgi:hypothetical protein
MKTNEEARQVGNESNEVRVARPQARVAEDRIAQLLFEGSNGCLPPQILDLRQSEQVVAE